MTPKEKAEYLIEKYYQKSPELFGTSKAMFYAKQCALICVDEIISIMITFNGREIENNIDKINFWQQVKTEIEKL
jgi:hypothetical protein